MSDLHYFFALPLPKEIKAYLNEISRASKLPFSRWVHEEDYHITLAFLGKTDEERLQAAMENISTAIKRQEKFMLALDSFGTFGSKASPRIFWAGVKESSSLQHTQQAVYEACSKASFLLDRKPFHPHITIARKWEGEGSFAAYSLPVLNELPFSVEEIVLFETHSNNTPKYRRKNTFSLRKNSRKEQDGWLN